MKSMTGYGKGEISRNGRVLMIEIKSINNRFLDINLKYPRSFVSLDDIMRKTITSKVSRGRLEVFVTYQDKRELERKIEIDENLASGYVTAYESLKKKFMFLADDFSLTKLMEIHDVLKVDSSEESLEEISDILIESLNMALDELDKMKEAEGKKLVLDIEERLSFIEDSLVGIKDRAPKLILDYAEKIRIRVNQILAGIELDENKLISEVAFFADKSNIDEEITRLFSHISQFKNSLKVAGNGKKLDFLLQEFNREANTICSKANDSEITNYGLSLKCEIEKIREQVQNLE